MLASLLTTLSFACSGWCGGRVIKLSNSMTATLCRSLLALCLLGAYVFTLGQGFAGAGLIMFIVSGAVGFGFGDLALFECYSRLGPRRTVLLAQCLAAPIACLTEWLWLGTHLNGWQILLISIILAGVSISLAPAEHLKIPRAQFINGALFGSLAAAGQGWGAVLSRRAFELNHAANTHINAPTATFQRMLGGALLVSIIVSVWLSRHPFTRPGKKFSPWILAHTLAGPVIGVSCFQWALSTTPSGIVLAIVATTPIVIMPLTHWLDGDTLTMRNLIGAVIAVSGVIGLLMG
ncbi:MAG: DMT family transporter [Verrucomicrobiales bacterium]|nr:DMT family transporter [Verrucomicrobiales bacterium]